MVVTFNMIKCGKRSLNHISPWLLCLRFFIIQFEIFCWVWNWVNRQISLA